MKRTKSIHHASFRKSWSARHLTPVALAVTAVFMLAGCEKSDETVSLYQNADDCSAANPGKSAECTTAYNNALKEAERTAPKYATREDCVAELAKVSASKRPHRLAWRRKIRRRPNNPAAVLDAAYGRLHDGTSDGRRRRLAQQPLLARKTRPALHTANIPMRQVKTTARRNRAGQ